MVFSPFNILNISCHFFLARKASAEKSVDSFMGFPLYITLCFFSCVSRILSFSLTFAISVMLNLGVGLFCLSCLGLYASCTWRSVYCFRLGKFSVIILLNAFFFFLLSSLSCLLGPLWCWYWYAWCYPKDRLLCFSFFNSFFFSLFLWVIFIILPSTSLTHFLYLVCCSFLPVWFSFELLYS